MRLDQRLALLLVIMAAFAMVDVEAAQSTAVAGAEKVHACSATFMGATLDFQSCRFRGEMVAAPRDVPVVHTAEKDAVLTAAENSCVAQIAAKGPGEATKPCLSSPPLLLALIPWLACAQPP